MKDDDPLVKTLLLTAATDGRKSKYQRSGQFSLTNTISEASPLLLLTAHVLMILMDPYPGILNFTIIFDISSTCSHPVSVVGLLPAVIQPGVDLRSAADRVAATVQS